MYNDYSIDVRDETNGLWERKEVVGDVIEEKLVESSFLGIKYFYNNKTVRSRTDSQKRTLALEKAKSLSGDVRIMKVYYNYEFSFYQNEGLVWHNGKWCDH